MLEGSEYSPTVDCFPDMHIKFNKKKRITNQRRFSDEQIRSLENMFETETKLEPRKKVQLAKELGLQPRQVAIWFQNKRARWKSKQIEHDYNILLSSYNNMAAQHETLKKENKSLLVQLQKLKEMVGKSEKEMKRDHHEQEGAGKRVIVDQESEVKNEFEGLETGPCLERLDNSVLSDEDGSMIKDGYFETELMNMVDAAAESSLTSTEDWGGLDSEDLLKPESDNYQWWDFWS